MSFGAIHGEMRFQLISAVTLDGTIIHKSGLITGGQGSSQRRFNDSDVQSLNKAKETYMKQLHDLHSSKPKADDGLLGALSRLDAESAVAKDDLDAIRVRLVGLRKEAGAVEKELKKLRPERETRQKAVNSTIAKLDALEKILREADDGVFGAFCAKIGVENIKDYEDVQLRVAKEHDEALEKFSAHKTRVWHQ